MTLKSTFIAAVCAVFMSVTASAALSIIISPINGDTNNYLLSATGTGDTGSGTSGTLGFNESPFVTNNGGVTVGLNYGGAAVTTANPLSEGVYRFVVEPTLVSGTHSFSGGPITVTLTAPYLGTFNPGDYTITSGDGIFGLNPTGTLTILSSPIPEPSTYAALTGLAVLGFVAYRRRKRTA